MSVNVKELHPTDPLPPLPEKVDDQSFFRLLTDLGAKGGADSREIGQQLDTLNKRYDVHGNLALLKTRVKQASTIEEALPDEDREHLDIVFRAIQKHKSFKNKHSIEDIYGALMILINNGVREMSTRPWPKKV